MKFIEHIMCCSAATVLVIASVSTASAQTFRHVEKSAEPVIAVKSAAPAIGEEAKEAIDSVAGPRTAQEILSQTVVTLKPDVVGHTRYFAPQTFAGHRELHPKLFHTDPKTAFFSNFVEIDYDGERNAVLDRLIAVQEEYEAQVPDSVEDVDHHELTAFEIDSISTLARKEFYEARKATFANRPSLEYTMPEWMLVSLSSERFHDDLAYSLMVRRPETIDYAYWDLPVPPTLPDDTESFRNRVVTANVENAKGASMLGSKLDFDKIHWIHKANAGVQFSQAYLSENWYQGGNSSLALLVDLGWDVGLNQVWHPNLLLTSSFSYKLGVNSTPDNEFHKYMISQDLFQWNAKAGVRAWQRWFYSLTAQFKTQIFNQYPKNSFERESAFMTPGDLNIGLGMTYNYVNKKKTLTFNASIAPVSYNLRTRIDRKFIDTELFNVPAGEILSNEYGSNAELTLNWNILSNINYKSRLFLFSDYSYFQGDWENTLSFTFNKFLSTQIFWHVRYDSSTEPFGKWGNWMAKEILSFGITYTFSTKD